MPGELDWFHRNKIHLGDFDSMFHFLNRRGSTGYQSMGTAVTGSLSPDREQKFVQPSLWPALLPEWILCNFCMSCTFFRVVTDHLLPCSFNTTLHVPPLHLWWHISGAAEVELVVPLKIIRVKLLLSCEEWLLSGWLE